MDTSFEKWKERLKFYCEGITKEQQMEIASFVKYKYWQAHEEKFNRLFGDSKVSGSTSQNEG